MRRRLAVLALGTLLVACSGDPSAPPPPSSEPLGPAPTESPSTTLAATTSTTLGFTTPAVIDVPYVQRVLDEIYRLDGEAARYIYAKRLPDAEFNARLEAIFGEPALGEAKSLYGQGAARGFDNFANPPGNPKIQVRSIVETTPSCILVRASLDFRPLFVGADRTQPDGVVQLSLADVLPLNPTGWGVVLAGTPLPGQELRAC